MWPWEHAAAAYLLYSLSIRATGWGRPSGDATLLALVGAVVPDLVDKPLSWGLGLFPTGYGVAHSAFVAVPVALLAVTLARRRGSPAVGAAFALGYWSHLAGDVLDPLRNGDPAVVSRVLWPVVRQPGYDRDLGLSRGVVYLEGFVRELLTTEPTAAELLALLLAPLALAVWAADGFPGTGRLRGLLARVLRATDAVRRA